MSARVEPHKNADRHSENDSQRHHDDVVAKFVEKCADGCLADRGRSGGASTKARSLKTGNPNSQRQGRPCTCSANSSAYVTDSRRGPREVLRASYGCDARIGRRACELLQIFQRRGSATAAQVPSWLRSERQIRTPGAGAGNPFTERPRVVLQLPHQPQATRGHDPEGEGAEGDQKRQSHRDRRARLRMHDRSAYGA